MNTLLLLLLIAGLGVIALLLYKILQNPKEDQSKILFEYIESLRRDIRENETKNRQETQQKLDIINERLSQGLKQTLDATQKQSHHSSNIIKEITEKLTGLTKTNEQVVGFAEKLQSLESILKNPKQRGILGEYFLETLLAQVFQPGQYKMQYKFSNGEIVDAVVFMRDKIIPIDAKFSLEKYNLIMQEESRERREKLEKEFKMDVKNRIDETSKYIRPGEGTTDFAFMFIPAEGVYYNLLIYKVGTIDINANDLVEYAFKKRVIIVSPTSFFAYLQTVLQGLNALEMEKNTKEIIKRVEELGKHLSAYDSYMDKLGKHLGTTVTSYNEAYRELGKIDKDVQKIAGKKEGESISPLLLEKPEINADL